MNQAEPLLSVRGLQSYYPIRGGVLSQVTGHIKAVDGVSFDIFPHETLGLVGESGCGKSTIGRAIMHLETITGGTVLFDGEDTSSYTWKEMRSVWPRMQMVFQDPYSSLNPRKSVESTLTEILRTHRIVSPSQTAEEIERILRLIGLPPESKRRFPHEFSGGQRQRICIARALTLRPKFLICDEAISALDVSIQAQILGLFRELQGQLGLTYLFIAHSLGAVKYLSSRIAVMYLGKIVELAPTELIFSNPRHPYTQALLSAYPDPNPENRETEKIILPGQPPSAANPPRGCHFNTRCPFRQNRCGEEEPELKEEPGSSHHLACHFSITRSDWKGIKA
ncbi:peptide ABC transporter ATP-binding protein [Spirochaetia bacterium]|nr:peptide ABC transporter ATP-binding protein [Spirochaetia bacterium]